MNYANLTKIGVNEFRIDFKTTVRDNIEKSVVVDGETYTRIIPNTYEFNSAEDFKNAKEVKPIYGTHPFYSDEKGYWRKVVVNDFKDINGEIYYVWNYLAFSTDPSKYLAFGASTDGYANILKELVNNGHVKNVLRIYNIKSNRYKNDKEEYGDIIRERAIPLTIYKYGYNNALEIAVNFYSFLKLDFATMYGTWIYRQIEDISKRHPDLIQPKLLSNNLSCIEINDIAINLLNKSINYKQHKN